MLFKVMHKHIFLPLDTSARRVLKHAVILRSDDVIVRLHLPPLWNLFQRTLPWHDWKIISYFFQPFVLRDIHKFNVLQGPGWVLTFSHQPQKDKRVYGKPLDTGWGFYPPSFYGLVGWGNISRWLCASWCFRGNVTGMWVHLLRQTLKRLCLDNETRKICCFGIIVIVLESNWSAVVVKLHPSVV